MVKPILFYFHIIQSECHGVKNKYEQNIGWYHECNIPLRNKKKKTENEIQSSECNARKW